MFNQLYMCAPEIGLGLTSALPSHKPKQETLLLVIVKIGAVVELIV